MEPLSPDPPEVHSLEEARLVIAALWKVALRVEALEARVAELEAENSELRAELHRLKDLDDKKPPSWAKANIKRRRRKKKGPKKGHKPAKRTVPGEVDEIREYPLDECPDCGGRLGEPSGVQTHIDIEIEPVVPTVREHVFDRYWCSCCKAMVRSRKADVVPRSKYGPRLHALVAWLKYGLGMTLGKVQAFLREQCGLELSTGTLSELLARVGDRLAPAYDDLLDMVRRQSVLYADESGWRVDGVNHYLWVFTNDDLCLYQIRRSRGSQVLVDLLGKSFPGVLCSDFYAAYGVIEGPKQKCLVHLMRDLRKLRESDDEPVAQSFSRKLIAALKRIFKLHGAREQMLPAAFDKQAKAARTRVLNLAFDHLKSKHPDCKRLAKRISKHRQELFVCLEIPEVEPGNNQAERGVRPAVLMRKTSYGNRSDRGRRVQEVLMSLIQTCRKRGVDFMEWAVEALVAPEPPPLPLLD